MKLFAIVAAALFMAACSSWYESRSNGDTYREVEVRRALVRITASGGCWLDVYFADGSKIWVDADRLVCGLKK